MIRNQNRYKFSLFWMFILVWKYKIYWSVKFADLLDTLYEIGIWFYVNTLDKNVNNFVEVINAPYSKIRAIAFYCIILFYILKKKFLVRLPLYMNRWKREFQRPRPTEKDVNFLEDRYTSSLELPLLPIRTHIHAHNRHKQYAEHGNGNQRIGRRHFSH